MANTRYALIQDVKAQSDTTDPKWDVVIQLCLNAAAETIDGFCNRTVPFVTEATASPRLYAGSGKVYQRVDDFTTVTLVEYKNNASDATWKALTAADWIVFAGDPKRPQLNDKPFNAIMLTNKGLSIFPNGGYGTALLPTVQITARWGYADEVPSQVRAACIAQASRWWKRGQGQWNDTLANAEMGMLMFKKDLDPDIKMMLVNSRLVRPSL